MTAAADERANALAIKRFASNKTDYLTDCPPKVSQAGGVFFSNWMV